MNVCRKWLPSAAIAISLAAGPAVADQLSATAAASGGGASLAIIGFANLVGKHTEHRIEVNSNVPAPINMVSLARGETDIGYVSFGLGEAMARKAAPFDNLDNAQELWGNIRLLFSFPAGYYHFLTYADSGIESFEDLKGKVVYAGPPNAAQEIMLNTIVEASTDLVPGKDYTSAKLDFAGGDQAFKDGSVSFLVKPSPLGGALIEQFGLSREFRLIGIPDEALASPQMQAYFATDGRVSEVIPPFTYTGQVNEGPVNTVAFLLAVGTNKDVDEQVIYELMSAFLTNYDAEFRQASKTLFSNLDKEKLLAQMTAPLHAGAVRAYREAGIEVPDRLVPPEMR